MKIKIVMIRHGKTKGNTEGRYIGCRTDEPLLKECTHEISDRQDYYHELLAGDTQNAVSDLDESFKLYVSPMRRCIETCRLIFGNKASQVVEDFKELDFGSFENKNHEELNGNEAYQAWIDSNGMNDFPEGESFGTFSKRCMLAFDDVIKELLRDECGRAAIVCHGGTIMAVLNHLTGKNPYDCMVKNGGGYELILNIGDEGKYDLLSYNRF